MTYDVLVKNIELLAREKGVSKTKALIESGVGKDFTVNIQKKGTAPSIDKLVKLSNYFNTSVDDLLGLQNEKNKLTALTSDELDIEITKIYKALTPELRKQAIRNLRFLLSEKNTDNK